MAEHDDHRQHSQAPWLESAEKDPPARAALDADTRDLLRAEALLEPDGKNVEKVLDFAFQEFGLPKAMRSDNGPPFASTGAGRLSRLSVWWMKLGIKLERIWQAAAERPSRVAAT